MHEMAYCDCGRELHWPRTARYGHRLRCFRCGRSWRLVPDNMGVKPAYAVESQRPKPRPKPQVIVVVREAQSLAHQQQALAAPALRQLPAPRRSGLRAWLFGG